MASANFSHCIPFLPVKNLEETLAFYKTYLQFSDEWFWGTPPREGGTGRDGLNLLFIENPEHVAAINSEQNSLEICLFVSNIDIIYKEIKTHGLPLLKEMDTDPDTPKEFAILDCNGYILSISENVESEPLGIHRL